RRFREPGKDAYRPRKRPVSSLAGKVAIVTGGSRGIGAAIATFLADRGAARREEAERLGAPAREHFGRLDVLVNNAGILRDALLVRMKDDDWDRVLETNLKGAFLMARAAGRLMMRQRNGRIINIASTAGVMGN